MATERRIHDIRDSWGFDQRFPGEMVLSSRPHLEMGLHLGWDDDPQVELAEFARGLRGAGVDIVNGVDINPLRTAVLGVFIEATGLTPDVASEAFRRYVESDPQGAAEISDIYNFGREVEREYLPRAGSSFDRRLLEDILASEDYGNRSIRITPKPDGL